MTPITPDRIRQALQSRNVKLNPPATEAQITLLNARAGGTLHPYIVSIYKWFNGFACDDFDAKSMMEIWPIERVVTAEDNLFNARHMPFSDFFVSAEVFIQSIDDPERPVIALFKGTQIASSTYEFWAKFLLGDYNITRDKQVAR